MDKVDKILKRSLGKKGLMGVATSAHVCFLADKWAKGRFETLSYSRGVLKVSVKSSSHAQEISMQSEKIISYINNKMSKNNLVKQLYIINKS